MCNMKIFVIIIVLSLSQRYNQGTLFYFYYFIKNIFFVEIVVIYPTHYLNQYYANYDIFNFNLCTWDKSSSYLFQKDLSILKYSTFEPKNIEDQTKFISSLELVNKSFIDLKSYDNCGDIRECLYVYVKKLH